MSKLPYSMLNKYVFNRTGAEDPDVICGPALGEDASIINLNGKVLIVHADPIVGAVSNIGWLSVHIACNDIAVRGVRPRWILPVILLPENYTEELVDEVTGDIHRASLDIGVAVIGGHIGYAAGLQRPLIATTAIGIARKGGYVMTSTAKPGDVVVVTKGAGIEGTAIIAFDFEDILREKGVSDETITRAKKLMTKISVIEDSIALFECGARSMHDATRGGILEAAIEIALSSNVKIDIEADKIPLTEETNIFAEKLAFDPLKLLSSGTVVATIPQNRIKKVEKRLSSLKIVHAAIGEVSEGCGVALKRENGRIEEYATPRVEEDELAEIWKKYPRQ